MPIYFLTATDEKGKRDTHRVDAENSQDAFEQYESQGFTDIVLHSDDAAAAASGLVSTKSGCGRAFHSR